MPTDEKALVPNLCDNIETCFEIVHKINTEIDRLIEVVFLTTEATGPDKPAEIKPRIKELVDDTETLIKYLTRTKEKLIQVTDRLLGEIPRPN